MGTARYVSIDEEGYLSLDGARIADPDVGSHLLKNLKKSENDRLLTKWDETDVLVEAFDEPLIATHVEKISGSFHLTAHYGLNLPFSLETLCLDEWDRFHGVTEHKIPFVFSRQAQFEFFDLVDAFDDDSVTVAGREYKIPAFFISTPEIAEKTFWDHIYQTETPGWETGRESKPLAEVLPQLKLNKSRILVLGCGSGRDAAFFAQQGHFVTAVDFSDEAIQRAKQEFGSLANLSFIQSDIFDLKGVGPFDLIFEHACYAAILPEKRKDLISLWRRLLAPNGFLLGVFFIMSKRGGPPFGTSEWELRERLKKNFRFLYWTRWRHSVERRMGRELVVYAQASK